jgi:hypothetical protein
MTESGWGKTGTARAPRSSASDLDRAGLRLAFAGVDFLRAMTVMEARYPGHGVHPNNIRDLFAVGAGGVRQRGATLDRGW